MSPVLSGNRKKNMYRTNITEQNNFSLIESDGDTPDGDEKEEQKKNARWKRHIYRFVL